MNRRQKIIVSVTGIFIVLLALVGLTYAYFVTQIEGNKNNTSISVTTANLRLVYGNDDGSIIGDGELIEPDTTFTTKTFTVTNNGNETINAYAVVLENVSITDATTNKAVALNSTRDGKDNDFDLTLTCKNGANDCNGYADVLPEQNAILVTNSIKPGETHTYSAVLKYVETNNDQSSDMNKNITGRFNIIDTKDTAIIEGTVTNTSTENYYVQTNSTKRVSYISNTGTYKIFGLETGEHTLKLCKTSDANCTSPVLTKSLTVKSGDTQGANNSTGVITIKDDNKLATININANTLTTEIIEDVNFYNPYQEGTLAYQILDNGALITDATSGENILDKTIKINPNLEVTADGSSNNNGTFTNDGLFNAEDDYGTSYYYRGPVKNNYLNFNGYCWRIVRIEGDGSVKIILASESGECDQDGSLTEDSAFLKSDGATNTYDFYQGFMPNHQNSLILYDRASSENFENIGIPDFLNMFLRGLYFKNYGGKNSNAQFVNLKKYNSFIDKFNKLKYSKNCVSDNTINYDANGNVITNTTGVTTWYYDKYLKLYKPLNGVEASLLCDKYSFHPSDPDNPLYSYVSLLTADEVVLAGGKAKTEGSYYLGDNARGNWWLQTYSKYDSDYELIYNSGTYFGFIVAPKGKLYNYGLGNYNNIRPVLILKSGVPAASAEGTQTDPYNID